MWKPNEIVLAVRGGKVFEPRPQIGVYLTRHNATSPDDMGEHLLALCLASAGVERRFSLQDAKLISCTLKRGHKILNDSTYDRLRYVHPQYIIYQEILHLSLYLFYISILILENHHPL